MKVTSMHSKKLIEVDWFLKIIASRDPNVQILYFARMPNNVGERDEELFRREGEESLEIWSRNSEESTCLHTKEEGGHPREKMPREGTPKGWIDLDQLFD